MEDIKNFSNLNGNQMELLLELDEEEASLLEEMERQEVSQIARSTSHESLLQLESVNANVQQEDLELTEFPESEVETGTVSFADSYESVENSVDEHTEKPTCPVANEAKLVGEHSENAEDVTPCQENLLDRPSESSLNSRKESNAEETPKSNAEETPESSAESAKEPLTQCFLEGIQILELDMSESELLFAKSAAAMRAQNYQSAGTKRTSDTDQSPSCTSIDNNYPVPGHVVSTSLGSASVSTGDEEERYLRSIQNTQKKDLLKTTTGTKYKTKTRMGKRLSKKKKIQTTKDKLNSVDEEQKTGSTDDKDDSFPSAKKRRLDGEDPKELRVVNFQCNHCDFKCPFKEENIEEIVQHITPRERYNQLYETPASLKNFKENVKLSIMIAKNKAKTQVRFVSRLECTFCKQNFPLDVDGCEQLIIHYNWCKKLFLKENFFSCPYCNELIHRGSVRKHLGLKSKRQCTMNVAATLQLMSFACKWYAEKHKPICIVCNEKCWPYLGHRAELNPVCEPCRFNITSGKTTKLRDRELAGCAICGFQCSEKFVTYWASELESLFVGERCISKLENPNSQMVVELANTKEAKVKKLVEMAVASTHVHEKAQSKNTLSNFAKSLNKSNSSNPSQNFDSCSTSKSVQSVHEKAQTENTSSSLEASVNRSSSDNHGPSTSLKSDKYVIKQTAKQDLGSKSGTKVPVTKSISKQIKQAQCDIPVPTRANNGSFIPITGSFHINNNAKLPFATLSSVADAPVGGEIIIPKTSIDIDKVKSIVQGGVPYTLLLPNDTPKVVFRRCLPKITSDGVENPKTIFRPIKPRPDISFKPRPDIPFDSLNGDALKTDAVQSRENTECGSGITTVSISTRPESRGSVLSNVSFNQSCQAGYSPSPPIQASMRPQQPKYIIKYGNTLTDTSQETNSDQHEKNSCCIVIKTSSCTPKTEGCDMNTPWGAQVIKTPNIVCSGERPGNGKVFKKKRKPSAKTKEESEVVSLD